MYVKVLKSANIQICSHGSASLLISSHFLEPDLCVWQFSLEQKKWSLLSCQIQIAAT